MKSTSVVTVVFSLIAASPAIAEVRYAEPEGFTVVNTVRVEAPRAVVWAAAVAEVAGWWNGDHTVAGDASRMHIDAVPMGCFCETLGEDAGVVHLTVTMVNPEVVIRLSGGLGPLGLMGVSGNMTWEFESVDDATVVTFTYAVGGYRPGGLDELATPVDSVIADALNRLKSYAEQTASDESGQADDAG